MSKDRTTFGNRISAAFLKGLLNVSVPLLNQKIIPKFWDTIGGIVSSKCHGNNVLIECENGFIEIKIVTPTIWRVRASKGKLPSDYKSFVTIEPQNNIQLKCIKQYGFLLIKENRNVSGSSGTVIKVHEADSTIRFERVSGDVISQDMQSIFWSKWGKWAKLTKVAPAKEYHVGFGEKTGKLVKNGKKMIFWNTDPTGYDSDEDPLYQSEPIQISVRENGSAYGIYYDNISYSVIKPEKSDESRVSYFTEFEPICYYVFTGPTLKDVSKQIALVNGKLPLPPRWVLGNHQCRWSYYPESEVREIAKKFREKEIPCDAIHLDIDYMDDFRVFTWDTERFPDPKTLIADLKDEGFKTVVMTDPGLKVDPEWDIYNDCIKNNFHCKLPNGTPYQGVVWPGKCVFPDFTDTRTRNWWGTLYKTYLDLGVEAFWLDMAEPSIFSLKRTAPDNVQHDLDGIGATHREVHNIYGNLFAMATRKGLDRLRDNLRTFIFGRTAFSGIQRYAATWTGDNFSTWSSLRQSLPTIMNMGLSGQPFVAADLGGFSFNTTQELLTRWYQTGIFYPYCRNHSANGTKNQEPWVFGEETEKIIKETIEFRYRLLPYLYSILREASTVGLPMMRPIFMEFPKDKECYNENWHNTQFMIGDKLLVAPILEKGRGEKKSVKRKFYLPKGKWIDFWSHELLIGGQVITRDVPITHVPLFIRSGTAIAMGPVVPNVEKSVEHPLTITIFPDLEISGSAYLDDGITKDFEKNDYSLLTIKGNERSKSLSLEISNNGNLSDLPSTNNILQFEIYTKKIPNDIKVNDRTVRQDATNEKLLWKLDESKNKLEIVVVKPEFPLDIQIHYK